MRIVVAVARDETAMQRRPLKAVPPASSDRSAPRPAPDHAASARPRPRSSMRATTRTATACGMRAQRVPRDPRASPGCPDQPLVRRPAGHAAPSAGRRRACARQSATVARQSRPSAASCGMHLAPAHPLVVRVGVAGIGDRRKAGTVDHAPPERPGSIPSSGRTMREAADLGRNSPCRAGPRCRCHAQAASARSRPGRRDDGR